jgi:hypothetical protein
VIRTTVPVGLAVDGVGCAVMSWPASSSPDEDDPHAAVRASAASTAAAGARRVRSVDSTDETIPQRAERVLNGSSGVPERHVARDRHLNATSREVR